MLLDQELISYQIAIHPVLLLIGGDRLQKKQKLRPFQWDQDEIWQECSSSKYASTDAVGFST